MATQIHTPATFADLHGVEGKAELINGEIVHFMSSGVIPSQVALEIAVSLRSYVKQTKQGLAFGDGIGYAMEPPLSSGRQSFSPDASYYLGPGAPRTMGFVDGTPTLAVEVRSENDYGPAADRAYAAKRADYFEAGTLVVWDVDPKAQTVAVYRHPGKDLATIYASGTTADAEPAVPGWRVAVDDLFSF